MERQEKWMGDCLGPTLALGTISWVLIAVIVLLLL
jgi:hypothetical protein